MLNYKLYKKKQEIKREEFIMRRALDSNITKILQSLIAKNKNLIKRTQSNRKKDT